MTRIEIAALAMQGMLAHSTRYKPRPSDGDMHWHNAMAREAVQLADALLIAAEVAKDAQVVAKEGGDA